MQGTFSQISMVGFGVTCGQPKHFELKQQKLCVGFLLTNRQFQEVGHCRRHIFGPIIPKFYVELENTTSSSDNLRPFCN